MNNNLAKINLNLLLALEALMKERHVTNAGRRLNITQSAMSNTLKQLRDIFSDELFMRGQNKHLIPTAYMQSLEPKITEAIEKLSHVFQEPESFNPKAAQMTFTLGLSDYTEYLFLPGLLKHILQEAPGIKLVIKHLTYIKTQQRFENDEIDLALGIYLSLPDLLISQPLYKESFVCLGSKDNPLLQKPICKKTFAEAKHFIIQYTETRSEMYTERIVKEMGLERNGIVSVPNTLPALRSLADTDLITVVLKKIAQTYCYQSKLKCQDFEFEMPNPTVSMVWHPKHKNNLAHRWLRTLILEIAKTL